MKTEDVGTFDPPITDRQILDEVLKVVKALAKKHKVKLEKEYK